MKTPPTTQRVPLRILLDNGPQSGRLDGAWWPQSRDLDTEAADLVDHFPQPNGRIERLLFSPGDWDTLPGVPSARRIQAQRGPVKVGSFPRDDTHLMVVKMPSARHLRLLVIPADTEPDRAAKIMEAAADKTNTQTPAELLAPASPEQHAVDLDGWVDEGGAMAQPR